MNLRPHQTKPAADLLEILTRHQSAVDLSDTGVGKTFVACFIIAQLKLPTLVVGPKISRTNWKTVSEGFGEEVDYVNYEGLRTGKTGFGWWEYPLVERHTIYKCQNCLQVYDPEKPHRCYTHPRGVHCIEGKKKPHRYGKFTFHSGVKFLILDECHRAGGIDSLNADMLIAAHRQGIKILLLSATLAQSPLKLRALGLVLGLHSLHDFYGWSSRYGCRRHPAFKGWHWMLGKDRQAETMEEIGKQIIPARGVRVRTTDIPGFPEREIQTVSVDVESPEKVNKLYAEMKPALEALATRQLSDACPEHPLTVILRLRQKIELLRVPSMAELSADFLEKGMSVALFVNFSQTLDELCGRLKTSCRVDGKTLGNLRDANIESFQKDESRVIVLNSEAGGISISLHDVRGEFPRVGLVSPTFSAVTFRQILGRHHRDGAKSPARYRVVFAANTVEDQIKKTLDTKLANLDSLADADFVCQ